MFALNNIYHIGDKVVFHLEQDCLSAETISPLKIGVGTIVGKRSGGVDFRYSEEPEFAEVVTIKSDDGRAFANDKTNYRSWYMHYEDFEKYVMHWKNVKEERFKNQEKEHLTRMKEYDEAIRFVSSH